MAPKLPLPNLSGIPKWFWNTLMVMTAVAIIPFVMIASARVSKSSKPRVEIIPDMDSQPKFKAQAANALFADGRAMRPVVPGTVARGELKEDDHYYRGLVNGTYATENALPITSRLLKRGQERYDIYCAPCHGLSGDGRGIVSQRAEALQQGTWIPPTSYHTDVVRERADGFLFNAITNGIRNMPAYGSQIPTEDRWAIVAYVRALQRSHNATLSDVPADVRSSLR